MIPETLPVEQQPHESWAERLRASLVRGPEPGAQRSAKRLRLTWLGPTLVLGLWMAAAVLTLVVPSLSPGHWLERWGCVFECLVPLLLTSYVAWILRMQDDRQRLQLVVPSSLDADTRAGMLASWQREADRLSHARRELVLYALAFGLLVTTLLLGALALHVSAQRAVELRLAAGGATAATVGFAIAFGNILARSARGDATGRTLAVGCRCVLYGVLVAVISIIVLDDAGIVTSVPSAVLTGLICSFLGEPLLETVFQTIIIVFGAGTGGDDNLVKFDLVEGLDEVERLRLNDLGVTSLQGLAFASTPFLYMFTRYGLPRICDWQDQALLLVLAGNDGPAWLRFFRGATKTLELRGKLRESDAAVLGMKSLEEVYSLMDRIALEPQLQQAERWRRCTPHMPGVPVQTADPSV